MPVIEQKIREIYPYPHIWNYIYDEAAAWFKAHVSSSFEDHGWRPTSKAKYRAGSDDIKPYLQTLKDLFLRDAITIARPCTHFIEEIKSYKKDENGKIAKLKDHLLDCCRYGIGESNFSLVPVEKEQPRVLSVGEMGRMYTTEPFDDGTPDISSFLNIDAGGIW